MGGLRRLSTPPMSTSFVFAGSLKVVVVLAFVSHDLVIFIPVTSEIVRITFLQTLHLSKVSSDDRNVSSCIMDLQVHDCRWSGPWSSASSGDMHVLARCSGCSAFAIWQGAFQVRSVGVSGGLGAYPIHGRVLEIPPLGVNQGMCPFSGGM